MPAQLTDEQIAEEIVRDVSYRPDRAWLGPAIVAALTRTREDGAEAMRERAAKAIEKSNAVFVHDDDVMGVAFDALSSFKFAAEKIRALPLTEVIPDGK